MLGLMGSHKVAWLQWHKTAEGTHESNVAFADTNLCIVKAAHTFCIENKISWGL